MDLRLIYEKFRREKMMYSLLSLFHPCASFISDLSFTDPVLQKSYRSSDPPFYIQQLLAVLSGSGYFSQLFDDRQVWTLHRLLFGGDCSTDGIWGFPDQYAFSEFCPHLLRSDVRQSQLYWSDCLDYTAPPQGRET